VFRIAGDRSSVELVIEDRDVSSSRIAVDPIEGKVYSREPGAIFRVDLDGANVESVVSDRVVLEIEVERG